MVPHSSISAWLLAGCVLLGSIVTRPALSQESAGQDSSPPAGLLDRDSLTDGWFGAAPALKDRGVVFTATEIGEVLGVVSGGTGAGAIYEGRLELDLDLDLDRILGLANTVLHANAYQIHGRGLSGNYLGGNLLTVSAIEATRSSRLFDLWIERGFYDSVLSIRLGQIAADDEFFVSQYSGGLLSATFGWPAIMGQALPSGGPAYPLATPGIRARYALNSAVSLQAAVFNGDPAGMDSGGTNPQSVNGSGTAFPFDHSPFVIAELSYAPGADSSNATPGTDYKFGAWYQGGRFDDLAVDRSGLSLADPRSSGQPRGHHGDYGFYAIADLQLYRPGDSPDRALGAFVRMGGDPGDRNFIAIYVDGGLNFKGPFAARTDDVASLGVSFAGVSTSASRLIHDLQSVGSFAAGAPDYEALIEFSYQVTLAPWWSVQPDLQMILHPTPASARPSAATSIPHVANALVAGIRTSIRF